MLASDIGVFVTGDNAPLFHYHFNKCGLYGHITEYTDLDRFFVSRHDKRIACLQMPYPLMPKFYHLLEELKDHCDNILVLVSELHPNTVEFIRSHDHPRISWFVCGVFNFELAHSPVYQFLDWFSTSIHFYKFVRPETLNDLQPYDVKDRYFDLLLGRKKLHRDLAYKRFQNDPRNTLTYLGDNSSSFKDPARWIWEETGLENHHNVEWTVNQVSYYNHRISLSQIIPIKVYNQTAYSLIAETNFEDHFSFYTEKTAKPILAKRLFVALAGRYFLRNLRGLGFKTFDGIIDESYDTEIAFHTRMSQALDQIEYLMTRPQEEILAQVQPICDHNFMTMYNTDWYEDVFKPKFLSYFVG
jgi:hypothetical protein